MYLIESPEIYTTYLVVGESCFLEITGCTIWHNYALNLGTKLARISICGKMEPGDSLSFFFLLQ